jgi:hypothetical protein
MPINYFMRLIFLILLSFSVLTGCNQVNEGRKAIEVTDKTPVADEGPSQKQLYDEVSNNIANKFQNGKKDIFWGDVWSALNGTNEYEINQIEKISCKKSKENEKIYECDVFIRFYIGTRDRSVQPGVQNPPLKVSKTIQKITSYKFYKSQNGWVSSYD